MLLSLDSPHKRALPSQWTHEVEYRTNWVQWCHRLGLSSRCRSRLHSHWTTMWSIPLRTYSTSYRPRRQRTQWYWSHSINHLMQSHQGTHKLGVVWEDTQVEQVIPLLIRHVTHRVTERETLWWHSTSLLSPVQARLNWQHTWPSSRSIWSSKVLMMAKETRKCLGVGVDPRYKSTHNSTRISTKAQVNLQSQYKYAHVHDIGRESS